MPMYVCQSGAEAGTEINEEGCFVITDDHDRDWFCREVTVTDPAQQPDYAKQFFRMGFLAHKIGINEAGLFWHGNADDEDDLREKLSEVNSG